MSAPTRVKIFCCISLPHLAITVLTPASLHSVMAMTLASRLLAMATITVSMLPMPSWENTSVSVMSAHLQKGISTAARLTMSSWASTASTSAPMFTSSFATARPYRPSPRTAYVPWMLIVCLLSYPTLMSSVGFLIMFGLSFFKVNAMASEMGPTRPRYMVTVRISFPSVFR